MRERAHPGLVDVWGTTSAELLTVSAAAWRAFIAGVKDDEFTQPRPDGCR